jgi:hypothetical protein
MVKRRHAKIVSFNDLDNLACPDFVPPEQMRSAYLDFANGMYFWYSFGTWLRKRDGTVPVSIDLSISWRCDTLSDFFFLAVAVFAFGVPSAGLFSDAAFSDGAGDGADVA